jgi:hypothetical protein
MVGVTASTVRHLLVRTTDVGTAAPPNQTGQFAEHSDPLSLKTMLNLKFTPALSAMGMAPKVFFAGALVSAALATSIQPASALGTVDASGTTSEFYGSVGLAGSSFSTTFSAASAPSVSGTGAYAGATSLDSTTGVFNIVSYNATTFTGKAALASDLTFVFNTTPTVTFKAGSHFTFTKLTGIPSALFSSFSSTTEGSIIPVLPGETSTAALAFSTINGVTSYALEASAVPGPLPILGVAAAFGYSRKLRKRISQSSI